MRTGIDEYSMILLLGMQSFLLFKEDKNCTSREGNSKNYQTCHKPKYAVHDDETEDGSTYVPSLPQTWLLKYSPTFTQTLLSH